MRTLSRDEFKSIVKRIPPPVAVPIPEWGDGAGVYVRVMTNKERDYFEEFMAAETTRGQSKRSLFVQLVACDENRNPIFTKEDIDELSAATDFRPLHRIVTEGSKLNAVGKEQEKALKKNLESQATGDGSSDSAS